jgi:signal peptidase
VIEVRQSDQQDAKFLTKGDHNEDNDMKHYLHNRTRLDAKNVYGKVVAKIPFLGQFTILMTEFPLLRVLFLASIALLYLVSSNGI